MSRYQSVENVTYNDNSWNKNFPHIDVTVIENTSDEKTFNYIDPKNHLASGNIVPIPVLVSTNTRNKEKEHVTSSY